MIMVVKHLPQSACRGMYWCILSGLPTVTWTSGVGGGRRGNGGGVKNRRREEKREAITLETKSSEWVVSSGPIPGATKVFPPLFVKMLIPDLLWSVCKLPREVFSILPHAKVCLFTSHHLTAALSIEDSAPLLPLGSVVIWVLGESETPRLILRILG